MKGVIDDKQYIQIIDYIVNQLQEDDIRYDDVIRSTLLKLVKKAKKNNLYPLNLEGMKNYAKDIAMKLEIQLMLDGGECILSEDVDRLYRELLGNLPDEGPDINGFNVVAVIGDDNKINEIKKVNGGM